MSETVFNHELTLKSGRVVMLSRITVDPNVLALTGILSGAIASEAIAQLFADQVHDTCRRLQMGFSEGSPILALDLPAIGTKPAPFLCVADLASTDDDDEKCERPTFLTVCWSEQNLDFNLRESLAAVLDRVDWEKHARTT